MPVVFCATCQGKVLATNGVCPGCRKPIDTSAAGGDHRVRVTLFDDLQVPALCVACGEPSERVEIVGAAPDDTLEDSARFIATVLGRKVGPGAKMTESPQARLRVRRCEACARADGPLQPESVDHAAGRVVLRVHRKFAAAL